VPRQWAEDPRLGQWVSSQRQRKKVLDRGEHSREGMTAARAAKLEPPNLSEMRGRSAGRLFGEMTLSSL
jgi:hypothetical protein